VRIRPKRGTSEQHDGRQADSGFSGLGWPTFGIALGGLAVALCFVLRSSKPLGIERGEWALGIAGIVVTAAAIYFSVRIASRQAQQSYRLSERGWKRAHEEGLEQARLAQELASLDTARTEVCAAIDAATLWLRTSSRFLKWTRKITRDAFKGQREPAAWDQDAWLKRAAHPPDEFKRLAETDDVLRRLGPSVVDASYCYPMTESVANALRQECQLAATHRQVVDSSLKAVVETGSPGALLTRLDDLKTWSEAQSDVADALDELRHLILRHYFMRVHPDAPRPVVPPLQQTGFFVEENGIWGLSSWWRDHPG
jgi:hypothetical protein